MQPSSSSDTNRAPCRQHGESRTDTGINEENIVAVRAKNRPFRDRQSDGFRFARFRCPADAVRRITLFRPRIGYSAQAEWPSANADTAFLVKELPMFATRNLRKPQPPVSLAFESHRRRIRYFFLAFIIFTLSVTSLFAGTKIVHHWVLTDQPVPELKKILVIAVLENYLIRQEFEDEMEKLLAKSGIEAVRSHMVLPPRNELMEGELKHRIMEADYDAVLVIRPKAFRKETKEVSTSAFYVPPAGYRSLWPYWHMSNQQLYSTGSYLKENTYVTAEFNLYNTKDENLLWCGETDTVYSKNFGKLAREYANTLVKQLKKDKVIGRN